jgi:hypothetical protein
VTVDARAQRVGENEALLRTVNDRIADVSEGFVDVLPTFDVVCECGDADCNARFSIPLEDYREIREDATKFVMIPGHEKPDIETVVERHEGWVVVRKDAGEPAELAREARAEDN